jgi:hypothetical protein
LCIPGLVAVPEIREPAYDLDFDGDPDTDWNRLSAGWLNGERRITEADLLALLLAEAIVAAEFAKWLDLR